MNFKSNLGTLWITTIAFGFFISIVEWKKFTDKEYISVDSPEAEVLSNLEKEPAIRVITGTTTLTDEENLACIDRWLKKNNLNPYGDPLDTMYLGSIPLFDETTGILADRLTYLLQKFPYFEDPNYCADNNTAETIEAPAQSPATMDEPDRCPCFGMNDLFWAFNKMAYLPVDIASELSCDNTSSNVNSSAVRILFTEIDSANLQEQIYYNDLYVAYDSLGEHPSENMCSNGSTSMTLNPNEAKVCHMLLSQVCASVQGRTCPCFDLLSLEDFTHDVLNQKVELDVKNSCRSTDYNPSLYIQEQVQCNTAPCLPISTMQFGLQSSPQVCVHHDALNIAQSINDIQAIHCMRLLSRACQVITDALPLSTARYAAPSASPTAGSTPSVWLRCRTAKAMLKQNNCIKISGCMWINNSCYHVDSHGTVNIIGAVGSSPVSAPVSVSISPPTVSNSCSSISKKMVCKANALCTWKSNRCISK